MNRLPKVVGIVNITEDSFSDGGLYYRPEAAIARCNELLRDGAQIIDLGPAASHPDANPVPSAEEIRRLDPILTALLPMKIPLSIDSFQPETQVYAISRGVAFLNDIHGFPHAALYPQLAEAACKLIVMHSVHGLRPTTRVDVAPSQVWTGLLRFFEERLARLEDFGIARSRIVIDPGMGFFLGGRPEASLRVLCGLRDIKRTFGLPVLLSVSRKSFLRTITGRDLDSIAPATLAAELFASFAGVEYIRTHDARPLSDALRVFQAIEQYSHGIDPFTK